jgi:hypothetical protein
MKPITATTEKAIADSQLLRLYRAVGGRLPWGQNPRDLLISEADRAAQGQRLALLIERDAQQGKPIISDSDLVRLYRALR